MEENNMAVLLESIPYQPIVEPTEEEKARTREIALGLVRKVFAEIEKKGTVSPDDEL